MADKLDALLQPHLEREVALQAQAAHHRNVLSRVELELVGVQQRIQGIREAAELFQPSTEAKRAKRTITRNRGMSDHWKVILQTIDLLFDDFSYKQLAQAASAAGHEATNDTLRSQMSDYKSRGWVETAGIGAFRLTDEGRKAAGILVPEAALPQNENEAPNGNAAGASNTGGAATPSYHQPEPTIV